MYGQVLLFLPAEQSAEYPFDCFCGFLTWLVSRNQSLFLQFHKCLHVGRELRLRKGAGDESRNYEFAIAVG